MGISSKGKNTDVMSVSNVLWPNEHRTDLRKFRKALLVAPL